jgi:hypothetical protein
MRGVRVDGEPAGNRGRRPLRRLRVRVAGMRVRVVAAALAVTIRAAVECARLGW